MSAKAITAVSASAILGLASCGKKTEVTAEPPSEGKQLVMESIEAHGGTDKWYNSGDLSFRWTYHMTDKGPEAVVATIQTVNPKTLDVVHEVVGSETRFGIKDGQAWVHPADAEFMVPPAFWSLTPFYFIGIPFVFNDPGANFEKLAETIEFGGKDYTQVKVTYDSDAGASPDDWYVLLIDPDTKLSLGRKPGKEKGEIVVSGFFGEDAAVCRRVSGEGFAVNDIVKLAR